MSEIMKLGKGIKAIRKKSCITRSALAQAIGMSEVNLGRLERDEQPITNDHIVKISSVLDVSPFMVVLHSIDEESVPEEKLEAFRVMFPHVMALAEQLLSSDTLYVSNTRSMGKTFPDVLSDAKEEDVDVEIYGVDKADGFSRNCKISELEKVILDIVKSGGNTDDAYYNVTKYLWIKYSDGRDEERFAEAYDRIIGSMGLYHSKN